MKCKECGQHLPGTCAVCEKPAKGRYCSGACKQIAYRGKSVTQSNTDVTAGNTDDDFVTASNASVTQSNKKRGKKHVDVSIPMEESVDAKDKPADAFVEEAKPAAPVSRFAFVDKSVKKELPPAPPGCWYNGNRLVRPGK